MTGRFFFGCRTGAGRRTEEVKGMKKRKVVMDAEAIERSLTRVAYQIVEKNKGVEDLVLIGIQKGGVLLAERLGRKISAIEGVPIPVGKLDITLYRDDIMKSGKQHEIGKTDIPFSLNGKKVVIVDDVLFTGRTIRAAMDALMDFGRPRLIELAVLIDRGHREIPIRADFVGKNLPSSQSEEVLVKLSKRKTSDSVSIEETF
jgi:pyrimidine operon attenuation protein / uracil phosphoribosyltransferase